ncbi:hypothetical protein C5S29_00285, partial [ANME-1 cluster archaeon GoMg3.2]|nr:hypothetical protein [ANME-1 cluster archaeon GoMg3.2]
MPRINTKEELKALRTNITSKRDLNKPYITICSGT